MLSKKLWLAGSISFSVLSLVMGSALVACSSSSDTPDGAAGSGSGGSAAGGSGSGGDSTGGAGASGGTPGTGGSTTGGASPTGGTGAGGSTGGTPAGGDGNGGSGGTTGGAGGGSSGGSGGGNVGPGPSDIPPAPGPDNVPAPSGAPGGLTVLDWAGFPAAVTYSFDDNDGSQLNYYDQMHAIGGRYTFYLVTNPGVIGTAITDAAWKKIRDDGNEIGNHTTDHNCGTANIDGGNSAIQTTFGAPPTTLAAPYGDSACASQAPGRVFINRGVGPAQPVKPLDNSNPFNLNCYIPATDQAASEYNKNIDSALSQKGWVIYVIHGIKPTSHSYQPVAWEGLKGAIEYAKSKNVWIDTMENIGSYWLGQKAFAAATTQMNGDTTTWTWTLPEKFPTGKYLRVKVDGGTLTQGGAPLTWDPHGYYEIELDKKTLTLAP